MPISDLNGALTLLGVSGSFLALAYLVWSLWSQYRKTKRIEELHKKVDTLAGSSAVQFAKIEGLILGGKR